MTRPLIAITTGYSKTSVKIMQNSLDDPYAQAVIQAGGLPLLIPSSFPLTEIETIYEKCAGLLLSGGGDIDPALHGSPMHPDVKNINHTRDALEVSLIRQAVETNWPVLGICRGQQILNTALGGSLYTDIPTQYPTKINHSSQKSTPRGNLVHDVHVQPGTHLARVLSCELITVNSRHHQAVKDIAPGFTVSAVASDGLIEGIELNGHPFCLGVQWHPENLQEHANQRSLFTSFIIAADEYTRGSIR